MLATYQQLLTDFANHVGLDPQSFSATQEVVIEGISVGLLFEGDDTIGDLLYFANLGVPADARVAEVYRTLMQANHFWVGTGGATLGAQQDTGAIILCGRIDVNGVSAESLSLLLDAFTDTAVFWQKFVADTLPSDSPAAVPRGEFIVRG